MKEMIMTYEEFKIYGKEKLMMDEETIEVIIDAFKCGITNGVEIDPLDINKKSLGKIKIILKEGE